ncbi:MAG TPA: tetratricopeptide repeat protein [Methylomirabilota bacterium]|nr:tetratricopeptide repeat protein [Methylomirabilota bacterium]
MRAPQRRHAALIFVLVLAAFLPAVGGAFLSWDDGENLVGNPHYRGLGPAHLAWIFTAVHMGHYIPVTWLTLALDYLIWGMNPAGYHLTAVLFHAASAVLVYRLAVRLLTAGFHAGGPPPRAIQLGAALAALVWGLHPLRVESVAWITERRDLVSGALALAATLAYVKAVEDAERGGAVRRGHYWTAVACFTLAVFAKSIVVGLPLVLVALDVYPLRRIAIAPREGTAWGHVLRVVLVEKLPFLAVAALAAGIMLVIGFRWGILAPVSHEGIAPRLALAAYSVLFYLGKTLWPWPLSPLYSLYRPVDPLALRYLLPAVAGLALTAVLVALRRRWPAGLTAWVAYIALLLPASGIFPNGPQITADRYSYLPSVGWSILVGAFAVWAWRAWQAQRLSTPIARAALAAALVLVCGLTLLTQRQIAIWRDSITLWRHAAWADPDSDIPLFYLGWALAEGGRFDEARAHFEACLARVPASLPALRAQFTLHLALVDAQAGRPAEAERRLREALALDPGHPVAWIRLGNLLWARGASEEAVRAWSAALERTAAWPRYQVWELRAAVAGVPEASPAARARLAFALALMLQEYRAHAEAEEHYRLAVRLEPGFGAAWNNLGVAYASQGRYANALDAFVHALRLQPGEPGACANARRAAVAVGARPHELDGCRPERT